MKHSSLMVNLVSAVYWFDEALQARLKAEGFDRIGRTQSMLLANVAAGEHRATRIARNLGVSRQAVSQILAELVARRIVTVSADPDDRRARLVQFHPAATQLRQLASAILADLEAHLATRLGSRRLAAMRQALAADWGSPPDAACHPAQPLPIARTRRPKNTGIDNAGTADRPAVSRQHAQGRVR